MRRASTRSLPEGVQHFDQHGFAVFSDTTLCEVKRHHSHEILDRGSPANIAAWEAVLRDWPQTQMHGSSKLRSLLKKGVPPSFRQQLWLNMLGCKYFKQSSQFNYKATVKLIRNEMVDMGISEYCLGESHIEWTNIMESKTDYPVPPQVLRQITVDIGRTFPGHRLFMDGSLEAKEGGASLFRLLAVYAFYNPRVAYCQGMSYIAGMLLMQMSSEEEAFWAMVALFEKPKYLAGYFDQSLTRIQQHAAVFQKLITHRLPKVANHLMSVDLHLLTFVTPWFMCLYTSFPCWDTVLSIWDLILLDGISVIFRVALATLRVCQDHLLQAAEISHILPQLLHPSPELVCAKTLLPIVWRTTVDKWEIDALQAIVAEESDTRPGRKRRRHIDPDLDDSNMAEKRPRSAEANEESETSVFQKVLSLFRSSNRKAQRGSSTRSQAARMRTASRTSQARRMPGTAKVCKHPQSDTQTPRSAEQNTKTDNNNNLPLTGHKATQSLVPVQPERKAAQQSTVKSKVPDSMQTIGLTASVKWSKYYESTEGSCTSPWREGLKALSFSLPIQEGFMIFGAEDGANTADLKNQLITNNKSEASTTSMMSTVQCVRDISSDVSSNSNIQDNVQPHQDRVSPCVIATENQCLDSILKPTSSTAMKSTRPDVEKGVRFSPRLSAGRQPLAKIDSMKTLNTPSERRLISRSAKVQHSFKSFHTPTPLRRSQVSRLNSSVEFSSPEVELQPMTLRSSISADA